MRRAARFRFATATSRRFGPVRRPIIPALLIGPKQSLSFSFVLDSGADISMIPYSVGEALGLSVEGAPRGECKGIGEGLVAYRLCTVRVRFQHIEIPIRVAWSTLDESPLLLGRLDVFDQLDIEFRQRTNAILLRPAAR